MVEMIETLSQRAGSFRVASVSTMVRTWTRLPFQDPSQVMTPAVPSETSAASVMTVRTLAWSMASATDALLRLARASQAR